MSDMAAWRAEAYRISELVDPEYMTLERAEAIGELWEQLQPRRILEIGTYKGTGACYLGAMAACYGGHVWTVDLPWTATHNDKLNVLVEEQLATCRVTNVDVVRRADGAEGWLREFFAGGHTPLDFAFIDGGHTWLNTAAQFVMALAAVRIGGWVCMDDLICPPYPDVRFMWEHVVKPLYPCHYERGTLGFVLRRTPQARPW
jgi:predicted O-methyltransferase YrrM